jgi:pyocin large subunit-like protein
LKLLRLVLALVIAAALLAAAGGVGFRSKRLLDQHYSKHGQEFGHISKAEYLRLAQQLRDAPPGGKILEAARGDGVVTKFDRSNGHFIAYEADGTIRTFFIPVQGESYFRRQARR